jgi:hypothetical protein
VGKALEDLEAALERLTQISLVQLSGAALDKKDQDYIKGIGSTFAGITERLMQAVSPATPPDAEKPRGPHDVMTTNVVGREETLKAPLVADVHTDLNTKRVLEEGVGPVEWMLALSRMPNGTLSVAVGPVFSQRELVHRLDDRLTNEKWRGLMSSGRAVAAPRWWSEDRPIANGFELPCTRETCKR